MFETRAFEDNLGVLCTALLRSKSLNGKKIKLEFFVAEELTLLNRNVSEGRGDARSDHKVEQWKREMTREIHSLQQQVNSQRSRDGDDNSAGSQVAALSRDLHEL